MSYYILPKKNTDFDFNLIKSSKMKENEYKPQISFSLCNYLSHAYEKLKKHNNDFLMQNLINIINPYEFIFTKVPNSKFSVSKLNTFSNMFYIILEIINVFKLLDFFENVNIDTMIYGNNSTAIIECLNIIREKNIDTNINSIINIDNIQNSDYSEFLENFRFNTYDFLYYELNETDYTDKNYIIGMIYILCNIFNYQKRDGVSIIKIDNIYYKPILEILYILTGIYENVYIIKPNMSNVLTNEKFIVCKKFLFKSQKLKLYHMYLINLKMLLDTKKNETILSILKNDIPYYFINKIEELNIIIGHQQLEYINQLIALCKSKNKEDKFDILKKNNIQKCIIWCEKFKIPYNKFIDKVNIFLNEEKIDEEKKNIFLSPKITEEFENIIISDDNDNFELFYDNYDCNKEEKEEKKEKKEINKNVNEENNIII